ncbi:MAG TPA: thymidine phosphorylase [Abditibacterium sp.]|jgi:pyrimidine-nucleoside phosphorylase
MNFLSLLEAKRDGATLSDSQIAEIVAGVVDKSVPDYQLSALLMAIYFRGLSPAETRALTLSMRDSGDVLSFPEDSRPIVDKHSTGGIGDKVSLPLAPLLACLGFRVPMISGRGLGITGGTLDKLESIPGFSTRHTRERIIELVQTVGLCMAGQTETMVPADKKLYALRDVTATVPSIQLITASILSKKLAEGLEALILDVKWGRAAFMQTREDAQNLADAMVQLGNDCGVKTQAFLNDMNVPLGRSAGNWLEVIESVETLEGGGPPDTREIVVQCAARLLVMTGKAPDLSAGLGTAANCLDSGLPRAKWDEMLVAQGADLAAFDAKLAAPMPTFALEIASAKSGVIADLDARIVGEIVRDLGGGRLHQDSVLNLEVGVAAMKKPGEPVEMGESLAILHATSETAAREVEARLESAWKIEVEAPPREKGG